MALVRCIVGRNGYQLFQKTFSHQFLRNLSKISPAQLRVLRKSVTPAAYLALYQTARILSNIQKAEYTTNGYGGNGAKIEISYEELLDRLDSGDVQLFDVREPKEIEQYGKIPQATNIPLTKLKCALSKSEDEFQELYGVSKPTKTDTNVVFYGLSDIKGVCAVEISYKQGFKKVRHYPGGFYDWSQKHRIAHG